MTDLFNSRLNSCVTKLMITTHRVKTEDQTADIL